MDSNKKYIYNVLIQNSKCYWKFLIGYVLLLLLLFEISDICYDLSTTGIILIIIVIVSLWIITMWITVFLLKKLFTDNIFLNWNIFDNGNDSGVTPIEKHKNSISDLSQNIEIQFVKYWYNEISRDNKFSDASRSLIENTLQIISEVLCSIDKTHVSYAVGNIFLRHLKEFRRTLKLMEKNGSKITELYRYGFASTPSKKSNDYYIHQITKNLLVNFVHWELWNSIPCQLVISIISRKLSYLMDLCANPQCINYYLLKSLLSDKERETLKMDQYAYIKIEIGDKTKYLNRKISLILIEEEQEFHVSNLPKASDQKCHTEQNNEIVADFVQTTASKPATPQQKPKEQAMENCFESCENQVKVYEPKSATKIWSEALDLDSITLGEDPLGSYMHEDSTIQMDHSQKYDTTGADMLPDDREISPLNNNNKTLLEEVKHMTSMEGLKNSMKPLSKCVGDATANTLRDIKDFQESTVNTVVKPMSQATSQALHKIGDLQDEAAGVVEGLFDFGMAGIRKGLKLTGLQENNAQEVVPSINKAKLIEKGSPDIKHSIINKKAKRYSKAELAEECIWVNPLQCNPPFDDDTIGDHSKLDHVPSIMMDSSEYESPDPEYEEAADLASTIAKLRSLLQQKSSESASTTPIASPMISEDNKSIMDLDDVDSFVPSFYKLCAKTATGVFNNTLNTIKTALPVNANENITYDMEKWDYEDTDDKELNLLLRMNKLLNERKDFCTIETAYDAFDSQQPFDDRKHVSDIRFQDEVDEFESKVPLAKTMVDIICELIAESDTFISQEPFVKFILLVFGQSIDKMISGEVREFLNNICISEIPTNQNQAVLSMDMDVFVDRLISGIPDALTFIIGHSTLKEALNMLVSSIQIRNCNHDIVLQVFEFISLRLMEESSKSNTLFSGV